MPSSTAPVRETNREALRMVFSVLDTRGIKRAWLAKQLGVSSPTLSRYEHGGRRPPRDLVERAYQLLGLPLALLHNGHAQTATPSPQATEPPKSRRSRARRAEKPPGAGAAPNVRAHLPVGEGVEQDAPVSLIPTPLPTLLRQPRQPRQPLIQLTF